MDTAQVKQKLEQSRVPCLRISLRADLPLENATQSRLGGNTAILPADSPFPANADGVFLFPLVQINCAHLPANTLLPAEGWLLFFVDSNDLYGLDFNAPIVQNGFRVIYHNDPHAVWQIRPEGKEHQETLCPVSGCIAIDFQSDTDAVSPSDVAFERFFGMPYYDLLDEHNDLESFFDDHPSIWKAAAGCKIGGYAYFTQEDPRYQGHFENYQLLLQIDSITKDDFSICWGDVGIANFFIAPEDLALKNFDHVLYNWDCG